MIDLMWHPIAPWLIFDLGAQQDPGKTLEELLGLGFTRVQRPLRDLLQDIDFSPLDT